MRVSNYQRCRYWFERSLRRNRPRERLLLKARAEAVASGRDVDLILICWGAEPRRRGVKRK
jgi:hypothetical protein